VAADEHGKYVAQRYEPTCLTGGRDLLSLAAPARCSEIGTATLAQDGWPTKSIVVVVPFAAGGNTDVLGNLWQSSWTLAQ